MQCRVSLQLPPVTPTKTTNPFRCFPPSHKINLSSQHSLSKEKNKNRKTKPKPSNQNKLHFFPWGFLTSSGTVKQYQHRISFLFLFPMHCCHSNTPHPQPSPLISSMTHLLGNVGCRIWLAYKCSRASWELPWLCSGAYCPTVPIQKVILRRTALCQYGHGAKADWVHLFPSVQIWPERALACVSLFSGIMK